MEEGNSTLDGWIDRKEETTVASKEGLWERENRSWRDSRQEESSTVAGFL